MLSRTTTPLVVSYVLLIGAGILFLQTPPLALDRSATYNTLLIVWALFYIAGPTIALTSVAIRVLQRTKHLVALWHFEMSGLYLIVAANLVYSYALLRTGLFYEEYNVVAFSLVISAFASSFISRIVDAWQLVRAVNKVSLDGKGAQ
jgi:hypothetical protein